MSDTPAASVCDRCGHPAPIARDAFVRVTYTRKIVKAHVCAACGEVIERVLRGE